MILCGKLIYMGIAYESNNLGLPLLAPHSNPVVRQTFIKAEELNMYTKPSQILLYIH